MNAEMVLCVSSSYEEKFYLNPRYHSLPALIQEELKVLCVTYTAQVGGVMPICFDEEGHLYLSTTAAEADLMYDEIGANLLLKRMRKDQEELFEGLEMYYQNFFS